ncbi:MAG: hypothetical protein U1F06_02130 [Steroidobacteraceae bacterium]
MPGKAALMYSHIGVDSVNTCPSWISVGTVPAGLISGYSGACCSKSVRLM